MVSSVFFEPKHEALELTLRAVTGPPVEAQGMNDASVD